MNQSYLHSVAAHRVFVYADLNFGVMARQFAMKAHTALGNIRIYRNGPGRFCYTLPVSSTGSLWAGYGGWHYRVCSFLVIEWANPRPGKPAKQACQFIEPSAEFNVIYPMPLHQPTLCNNGALTIKFLSNRPPINWLGVKPTGRL